MSYTCSDLIADFIHQKCSGQAFLVTGGACAFIVDAIGRHPECDFVCFQHEQSAAMAADAVWRTSGKVGVTVATSGPGATNLITGIACSWFDSIPSIHITGQVNQSESREYLGANVRQAGFQETDIVSMVSSMIGEFGRSCAVGYREGKPGHLGPSCLQNTSNATDARSVCVKTLRF